MEQIGIDCHSTRIFRGNAKYYGAKCLFYYTWTKFLLLQSGRDRAGLKLIYFYRLIRMGNRICRNLEWKDKFPFKNNAIQSIMSLNVVIFSCERLKWDLKRNGKLINKAYRKDRLKTLWMYERSQYMHEVLRPILSYELIKS